MDWVQIKELREKVLMMRWMDDAVHIVRGGLSRVGRWSLRRFSRIDAYGEELKLRRTDGDEAFGLDWRDDDGVVTVRQDEM